MSMIGKMADWLYSKQPDKKSSKTQALLVDGGEAQWTTKDYKTYADEAYLKCIVAYRCINEIALAASSVDWLLMKKTRGGKSIEIEEHPILDLLDYPNPMESGQFLLFKLQAFIDLAGNGYLERLTNMTGEDKKTPKELYVLRPDRMKILTHENGSIKAYEYQVTRKVLFPVNPVTGQADVLHIKTFHPTDDWYGSAPTESMAREIDTHNEATTWNMRLLQNQARPGMLFFFKQNLTDEQYAKFNAELEKRRTGAMGAGKSLILEGEGTDAKPYGWSPAEMDYIQGNREKARAIALGYGVPPMLLGIPGDNTYSNYAEARLAFWETTAMSRINLLSWSLNNWLLDRKSGLHLTPDLDSMPALEPRRKETWEKAKTANWLTVNEKRAMTGYDDVENGDVVMVSSSEIPLEQAIAPPMEEEVNNNNDDEDEDI